MYSPCVKEHKSFFYRLRNSECYDGYDEWSMQPANVGELDYGSYGSWPDGRPYTLGDLWNNKTLSNNFEFENLLSENSEMT